MKRSIFSRSVCMLLACSMLSMLTMTGCSSKPALQLAEDGTSISAAMYDEGTFLRLLETYYPALEDSLASESQSLYVIPGLDNTTTLPLEDTSSDNGENNDENDNYQPDIEICDQMTPQGITVTDTYMFVSAYCGKHEHNSVIYMMDKDSGEYLKTIVLRGKTHAGGIAYVESANGIWVTTNQGSVKGQGELSLISLDTIMSYDLEKTHAPIEYEAVQALPETSCASSLAYYDDYLIVGHFDDTEKGIVVCYKLDDNGMPQMQTATTTMEIDNGELAKDALEEAAETASAQEVLEQAQNAEAVAKEEAEQEAELEAAATAAAQTDVAATDAATTESAASSMTAATTGAAAEDSIIDRAANAAEELLNIFSGNSGANTNATTPTTAEAQAQIEEKLDSIVSTGGLYLEQGIGADDGYLFLTESYGIEHSRFYALKPDTTQEGIAGWIDFDHQDFSSYMEMPRYLEQVTSDGDYLYFVFEGAANKYRDRDVHIHSDRIIKVSKAKIAANLASKTD